MHGPLKNLTPQMLVDELVASSASELAERYQYTLFLLIELGEDEETSELFEPLQRASMRPPRRRRRGSDALTTLQMPAFSNVETAGDADRTQLLARLEENRWFILPLQKRVGIGDTDTITVGRADDNDVVLRDGSVSKYHGFFNTHEDGSISVVDTGSKNGTRVNGQLIDAQAERWVQPMDHIQFGKVTTFTCVPSVLRSVLRARP